MKLLVLFAVLCLSAFVSTQITDVPIRSVGVQGVLLCGKQPAEGVKIRLFRTKTDDLKEMLAYKTTGSDGSFTLEGNTVGRPVNETDLIPTVRFYHNCDEDPKKAGYRTFILNIPKDFITLGRIPRNVYKVGTLNLQVIFPKEAREKNFKESATKTLLKK
ncbi:hypothetical protein QR680_018951 [Steinernema hermaphroditum]|uniref:Transthyretin-like family protein n=1 Tax=Steinernema hermaphroditum TaxID=289476 RepID=A0AA39HJI2_9BILA|nr:hypothetical protein QR680_018951 [Steinernema hermaphroditum]